MIYNACQIGINVNINDLAFHTLMAVNDYAGRLLKDKENEVPAMGAREFRKS